MNRTLAFICAASIATLPHIGMKKAEPIVRQVKAVSASEDGPTPAPQPAPQPDPVPEAVFLEIPASVSGDVGAFIQVKARTNGRQVRWVAQDKGLNVFPAGALRDSKSTIVTSLQPGEYRLMAYTALGDDLSDPVTTLIKILGHAPQPPPGPTPQPQPQPNPTPVPPPPPPVPQSANLWIVVIDNWAARTPVVTGVVTNVPFWNEMRALGHQYRNVNKTEAKDYMTQVNANGGIPCVVLMDLNGKWLNKDPADMRLPVSVDGMRSLIKKYSGR